LCDNLEDATHLEKQSLLDEYVLQDVGKIWVGTYQSHWGRQWVFGQFDKAVLPAVMFMLERANMDPSAWGNPIVLSRMISKMVKTFSNVVQKLYSMYFHK